MNSFKRMNHWALIAAAAASWMTIGVAEARTGSSLNGLTYAGNLGYGYDADQQKLLAIKCMDGTPQKLGMPRSSISLYHNLSAEDARSLLNIEAEGSLSISTFKLDLGAKIVNEMVSDDYSEVFTIVYDISTKTKVLENPRLSPEIERVLMEFGTDNQSRANKLKEVCGNEFVSRISTGAKLVVNVRFDFANQELKRSIEAQGKISIYEILSAKGKFTDITERSKEAVNVSITAHQMGGNPAMLSNILGGAVAGKNSVEAGSAGIAKVPDYAIIRCGYDAEGREACKKTLEQVLKYASPSGNVNVGEGKTEVSLKGSFADQVSLCNEDMTDSGCAYLSYETTDYFGIPGVIMPPATENALRIARQQFSEEFMENAQAIERAKRLLKMKVTPDEKADFTQIHANAKANMESLNIAADSNQSPKDFLNAWNTYLYGHPQADCVPDRGKRVVCPKTFVDFVKLNHRSTYYDFCEGIAFEMMGSEAAAERLKTAVERIRAKYFGGVGSNCSTEMDDLASVEELRLERIGLDTALPLQGLPKLRRLYLDDNEIADLTPIATIPRLELLSMRRNLVGSASPLTAAPSLRKVDLAYNRLMNFSELLGVKSVSTWKVFGNRFQDQLGKRPDELRKAAWLAANNNLDEEGTTVSEDEACSKTRKALRAENKISAADYDRYTQSNRAPQYGRDGVIVGWGSCSLVAYGLDGLE